MTVTGAYEGRPLFFTYDPSRGVAWSLIGAIPFQDPGAHQVVLKVADSSPEGQTIVRNMNVLPYPFPSEDLQLDDQTVKLLASGDTISLSGASGLSVGPNLHWEMHLSGPAVDAREWVTRTFP